MGGVPKHGLMLARSSLLERCLARVEPQVSAIAISANIPLDTRLPVLTDMTKDHLGPLAGILAGLDWAETQGATHMVSVAVDTPFFPCDLVPRLLLAGLDHPIGLAIAATQDGDHATFGLWPVALRAPLEVFLKDGGRKVRAFTTIQGSAKAMFADDKAYFNINTPSDLKLAATWV
ncbi:UNVERIFIED_CONTAM: hypothetical protein GTU68_006001 [Idotea baltica]|nr:hypothetical protein [Idotea baltica]